MIRTILAPSPALVAAGLAAALLFGCGPDAEAPPERSGRPRGASPAAPLVDAGIQESLARIRESVGADADAIRSLATRLPEEPDDLASALVRIRPELDLAITSGDRAAAVAALDLVLGAVCRGGADVRECVDTPAFAAVIGRALSSAEPAVRAAAGPVLGSLDSASARARILPILRDPDPSVRIAAIKAYASLAEPAGAARLVALFLEEREAAVRVEILRALTDRSKFHGPAAAAPVRAALESGTTPERLQALEYAGRARARDLVPFVLPLVEAPDRDVREQTLKTLLVLRDDRAREALERTVENENDPALRDLAGRALHALR